MKPLSIVFIALLCVCILSTTIFGIVFSSTADQVDFQETVLAGSSDAANGLTFRYEVSHQNFLYWDCRYTFGAEVLVDSIFKADGRPDYLREFVEDYPGVTVYDDTGYNYYYYDYNSGTLQGLARAWAALYRDTPVGNNAEKLIWVKDYCDYYPLRVKISTDTGSYKYSSIYADNSNKYGNIYADNDYDKQITQEFNDYFRIPVLEDEYMLLHGNRYNGSIGSYTEYDMFVDSGVEGYDHFELSTVSTATDTVSYFTFVPHSAFGETMDTSLIPGGYGIYAVDIMKNAQNFKLLTPGTLRTVLALDPSLTVRQIRTSADDKLLHVYAWSGNQLMLFTYDLASGREVARKILLETAEKRALPVAYFEGQDCELLYVDQTYYVVLTENDDGTMQHHLTVTRDKNQLPRIALQPCNICFDGKRLAIAYNKQQLNIGAIGQAGYYDDKYYSGSEIFVSVYDASGVIYSGKFDHALEDEIVELRIIDGVQVSASWD